MIKMYFTLQNLQRFVIICSILSTIGLSSTTLQAQSCSLACTGTVQVSLDMNCQAEITPDMVLNDDATSCPESDFEVIIQDHYGNNMDFPLSPDGFPIIDGSMIGYPAYVKVVDNESTNSCWGNLIVQDKLPPRILCPDEPEELYCYELIDYEPELADLICTDLSQHPSMGNTILIDDGAAVSDIHDQVRDLTISQIGCDQMEVSFEWLPMNDGILTVPNGVNVKVFYHNGISWTEIESLDYEGTAGTNNVGPLLDIWQPYSMVYNVDVGLLNTHHFRVSIIDKVNLTDEMTGNYGCPTCGTNGGSNRHFDNADVAFEVTDFGPELCNSVTFDMTNEVIDVNECEEDANGNLLIDPEILKIVTRTYVAEDKWGNKSEPCTITFEVLRHDEEIIKYPDNYFNNNGDAFYCNDFEYDHYGNPIIDPAITGVPYFDFNDNDIFDNDGDGVHEEGEDIALYPEPEVYCNVLATFTDLFLQIDCVTKVVRTWHIIEWNCDPRSFDPYTQMIEIADNVPPSLEAHHDITVSTNIGMQYNDPHHGLIECGALVNLPHAYAHDECDYDDVHVTINVYDKLGNPVDFVEGNGGYAEIPRGHFIAVYEAKDKCYNSVKDTIHVYVEDLTAPVTICDQNTVVSLNHQDGTHVYVETFDEGSYDDCQLARVVGRRMDANIEDCECPTGLYGFHYLGRYENKDYYLSKHDYFAYKAKSEAHALDGTVVSFNSLAEKEWVYSHVEPKLDPEDPYFWIGLKRDYDFDKYVWQDGTDLDPELYDCWANVPETLEMEPFVPMDCVVACTGDDNGGPGWYNFFCHDEILFYNEIFDDFGQWPYVLEMPVCGFSDAVAFCCDDAGEDNMVIIRAIDASCNYNDCMVNVDVQDKTAPVLLCPDDMIVNCDMTYDLDSLSLDFGYPYTENTCGGTIIEEVEVDLDQCHVGKIIRKFTATSSGGVSKSCEQTIYFEIIDPFWVNKDDPDDPNDDVEWPEDYVDNYGCDDPLSADYHPDVTGYPHFIGDDGCKLVGANWHDEIFTFNTNNLDNSCFKILRTWTIIDWCQQINGVYYTCEYTQVIKLNNSDAPEIISDCSAKEPVCTYDTDCEEGFIELFAVATDECTSGENMTWEFEIDLNYDQTYGSFDTDLYGSGYDSIADASDYYEIGKHLIRWTFYDRCGNKTSCDQEFTIVNCLKPTPYCLNGLAVDLGIHIDADGDTTGMVQLWASDFDVDSYHPCGYDIVASFSGTDIDEFGMTFTCDDFGNDTVMVWFWAVDYHGNPVLNEVGEPLQDFCITYVNVQDNQGACDDFGMRAGIEGTVMTENDQSVSDVMVDLVGSEGIMEMTDGTGNYAFPEMPLGSNYEVDPQKDDDHLNGVSTLDVVFIQRHVLGLDELSSPYKAIAADVNKDNTVSAIDVVELRKMILGIYNEFPSNESWRFIDKNFDFSDNYPFDEAFPEIYSIVNLSTDMTIDFVGVKVGDVNNSAILSFADISSEARSSSKFGLEYRIKGNALEVYADKSYDLVGMQFTSQLTNNAVLESIEAGQLDVDENHLAVLNDGRITFSWNELSALNVNSEEALFTLHFSALSASDDVVISSDVTRAEAYDSNFEIMAIEIDARDGDLNNYALFQNVPNPFTDVTNISFRIPSEMAVEFTIYDVTGQVVKTMEGLYPQGMNVVTLDAEQFGGVHYYTMKAGQFTSTKKMVVIK